MGCDIHGVIEVDDWKEQRQKSEKMWEEDYKTLIKPLGMNAITKEQWIGDIKHRWDTVADLSYLLSRNYDLFAFLFGVRRERPEEHYGCPAIAPNRNVPNDCDYVIKDMIEQYGIDGHSHSWITLKEIKQIDWSKPQGKISEFIRDDKFNRLVEIMNLYNNGTDENVRLVVFFDN